jgi:plastocyanin
VGFGGDDVFVDDESGTSTTTASVGDTVHWVWLDDGHDTVSGTNCNENGIWASPEEDEGFTFDFTFTQAGNYPYFCTPHCDDGMTGLVIVNP